MKVISFSEISVDFQRIIRCYVPEDRIVVEKIIYGEEKTIIKVYSKQIWK
jgi:hypothetical protein